ncbi:hypothetical protein NL676_011123 [Syzygium grande]|nr:hypothetical protein NL676_011123 [Syzygium grande]
MSQALVLPPLSVSPIGDPSEDQRDRERDLKERSARFLPEAREHEMSFFPLSTIFKIAWEGDRDEEDGETSFLTESPPSSSADAPDPTMGRPRRHQASSPAMARAELAMAGELELA